MIDRGRDLMRTGIAAHLQSRLGHPNKRCRAYRVRPDNASGRIDGQLAADHYFLVLDELEVFISFKGEKVSKPVNHALASGFGGTMWTVLTMLEKELNW